MAAEPGSLATGQRFGGCRVERPIGRGAHGALYAALDEASGQWCALKLLAPAAGTSLPERAEAARRFEQEARAAQRLQHPGIVPVLRAGTEAGTPYLVMALLGGCDLGRYTQPQRLLPEAVVVRVLERVAQALAYAHAQGVLHRDLKPANVMVDWAADRVTLTDFGLARLADAERTRTGLVLGSPAYMAPELLAGQPADARTDLYALGVMAFQLLSGALPFDAPGLGELLRQVAQQPAPDLRALRPELPPALATLVAQLLAKAPAERPAAAAGVAQVLASMREGWPGR